MLLHFPREVRRAVGAVWALDEALAAVVGGASQPALAAIKLAWWREALERLDVAPAPAEPRLQEIASELLPRGISGSRLATLETGWAALLEPQPSPAQVADRGLVLFAVEGGLLGSPDAPDDEAAQLFALADAQRRGFGAFHDRIAELRRRLRGRRSPRRLRPVTLATRLAARPITEAEGTPARAAALIAHRLTGRYSG